MALLSLIKFDGIPGRDWLVYKFPGQEFNTHSRLIVGEGQVALFVKGGIVCDAFGPGSYNLETPNIPILSSLINLPYEKKSPFTAEVFFINSTVKLDIKWGVSDPIMLIDPKYQIRLSIRAFGQMGLRIYAFKTFFKELIGVMNAQDIVSFQRVHEWFRSMVVTKAKATIAATIINEKISALEIAANLEEISARTKIKIEEHFNAFGINVVNFYIESINFPEEDFNKINDILAKKAEFEIMGDRRYVTERSFDVLESAASNSGGMGGVLAGAGVGMGVGLGMMNSTHGIGSVMNTQAISQPPAAETSRVCNACGYTNLKTAKFCNNCGGKVGYPTCPKCNDENPPEAFFCDSCGEKLRDKTLKCRNCNADLIPDSKFCNICGRATGL